jgi:Ca2+-binding EF-hand superfamily protein
MGWKECDQDGDNMLKGKEFRRCYINYRHMRGAQDFWNRYQTSDSLNMDEFINGVREMDKNMPVAEVSGYFTSGDMDGDGLLTYDEFEQMYW